MKERTLKKASADKAITGEHYLGRFSGNPHGVDNVNAPMGLPSVATSWMRKRVVLH